VLSAINTAGAGKVTAAISKDAKGLTITDNTSGAGAFTVGALNGSLAASQLGLATVPVGNVLTGSPIYTPNSASGGGIGYLIDRSFNSLIDPVDGIISRENKTLDDRAQQFQDRMDQLDKLIADKRARLEEQFANMESVLAGLQSQQQALSSLGAGFSSAPASSSSSAAKK
jgi:flagellar hook-associated protein 2